MKNILTNSLLAGLTFIIIYLILYFIDPSLNFNITTSLLISTVIYLFFLVRAGFQQRKNSGGFLSFGEVFISSIAIYAIASFIGVIFSYIMLKLNPELVELMQEISMKTSESIMSMTGMPEEQIALALEEANEATDSEQAYSLSTLLMTWLMSIIFPGLLYALIASLITKKKDETKNVE